MAKHGKRRSHGKPRGKPQGKAQGKANGKPNGKGKFQGKPQGKPNGRPQGVRNSRTESYRGQKNILTGKRTGDLGKNLRLQPVEFVLGTEFTLDINKRTEDAAESGAEMFVEVNGGDQTDVQMDDGENNEVEIEVEDNEVADEVEDNEVEDNEVEEDDDEDDDEDEVEKDDVNEAEENEVEKAEEDEMEIEVENEDQDDSDASSFSFVSSSSFPEITLDDSFGFSDDMMSDLEDNMSELDDDQIFALAASTIHANEDMDGYGPQDEFLDELLASGIAPTKRSDSKKQLPPLWTRYPNGISVQDVLMELEHYARDANKKYIDFPPMDGDAMWYVQSLAHEFGLTTKQRSKKGYQHVRVRLGRKQKKPSAGALRKLMNRRQFFPNRIAKTKTTKSTGARVRDGHVVGSNASVIERENFGHMLLRQMGWTEGSGLGGSGQGIVEPINVTVKLSKAGLADRSEM